MKPGPETDFALLRARPLAAAAPPAGPLPRRGERDYETHLSTLLPEFAGRSELLFAHAALIVAIRRRLDLAADVPTFERMWAEEGAFLREHLSLRWLVSACDTFADHAADPARRARAMIGTVLVNSVKLQETERLMLGLAGQPLPQVEVPSVRLFSGLSAFHYPRGDMVANMIARLRRVAAEDAVLGPLLEEMTGRLLHHDTVYRRLARLRAALPPERRARQPLAGPDPPVPAAVARRRAERRG